MVVLIASLNACQQPGGESPGSEFMPDMAHSVAYEANYYNYYYNNTWGSEEEYHKMAMPRKPVPGTIPTSSSSHMRIPANGSSVYPYGDTEEERTRASNEIISNPYPITQEGLDRGKLLYNINCGICHGEKGDGNGYLVRDGGAYPVQPAILTDSVFVNASNGRLYHAIIYGKNMMGGYTDKLSTEERWQVIHYVRALQALDKELVYNQLENTLNNIDRPEGGINKDSLVSMKVEVGEPNEEDDEEGKEGIEGTEGTETQEIDNGGEGKVEEGKGNEEEKH